MVNRSVSQKVLNRLVETQGHICIYCLLPFGTVVDKGASIEIQTPVGDHFEPFVNNTDSSETNAVASCQLCNSIKNSLHFSEVEECRRFVLARRNEKKYRVEFIPSVPITQDGVAWGREYSAYLSV